MSAGPYSYQLIDPPSGTDAGAYRNVNANQINDLGQVLGTVSGSTGSHSFLYSNGNYTSLDAPGAISTTATQLNNVGQILGRYSDAAGSHSFVYQDGNYAEVVVPDAALTTALQISGAGKILGNYFDSSGLHPFIDDNGTYTTLSVPGATSTIVQIGYSAGGNISSAINDADQVIGTYVDATGSHSFLYSDGSYTTLAVPAAISTTATQINNAGQILGTYSTSAGNSPSSTLSFMYSNGTYTSIAVPGATSTTAYQINDAGQVAGTYSDQTGSHVFLDNNGTYVTISPPFSPPPSGNGPPTLSAFFTQLTNAGDVLSNYYGQGGSPCSGSQPFLYSDGTSTNVGVPGATTTNATRINDLGQLIGSFYDGVTSNAFLATPIRADVMQPALLADLLPAAPAASALVAPTLENTNTGSGVLSSISDTIGADPQLGLLNNQGAFGL